MRATSTDGAIRALPEFKSRRSSEPTLVANFAAQLDAARAPAPVRGVQRIATRPTAGPARERPPAPLLDPADPTLGQPIGTRGPARPIAPGTVSPLSDPDPARQQILARAQSLLNVPYVWGGDTPAGLDCSAYVSRAWGVSRQTTDTLHKVADPIGKEELRSGDALNLPTWEDPSRHGHVRLFDRWTDESKTKMWVYEETAQTGKSVHRVIDWDGRYQPMRLRTLSA